MVCLGFFRSPCFGLGFAAVWSCGDQGWGAACATVLQVPVMRELKPFGLPTAPGHAVPVQEALCAPDEWDLSPVHCAAEPQLLARSIRSFQEVPSRNTAAPVTLSTRALCGDM